MKKTVAIFTILFVSSMMSFAQKSCEEAVTKAVEAWRTATMTADKATLENLMSDRLTYGHSSGKLDTKATFINDITTGKSKFVTMDLTNQQILVIDKKNCLVRHNLAAQTKDNGVDGSVKLYLMQVWTKEGSNWRMIGRQACKPPVQ